MAKYRALVNIQYSPWGFAKPGEEFEIEGEVDSSIAEPLSEADEEEEADVKPKRSRRKPEVEE